MIQSTAVSTEAELSEAEIEHPIDYLQAFTRTSNKSIYIIDVLRKRFEYVSENPLFLCGHTPQEVLELGFKFYLEKVKKEDLKLLRKMNEMWLAFCENIPTGEIKQYTLVCDFHLDFYGKPILVNHKYTPVLLSKGGKIGKAMCIVSLASSHGAGNILIERQGSTTVWEYNETEEVWKASEKVYLTSRETEILMYASQGISVNEIAEKMCVVPDTVKFHRKKLFEKLEVRNISQAIAVATSYKLI